MSWIFTLGYSGSMGGYRVRHITTHKYDVTLQFLFTQSNLKVSVIPASAPNKRLLVYGKDAGYPRGNENDYCTSHYSILFSPSSVVFIRISPLSYF